MVWLHRIAPYRMVHCGLQFYNKKTAQIAPHPFYILIYLIIFNIKYIINSLIILGFQKKKFNNPSKCWLGKLAQNKEKLVQLFKTWTKIKRKISFGLSRKSPKFEKYTNFKWFKLHLIHCTTYLTAKMRCSAVMFWLNFKPHRTAHVITKIGCGAVMVLAKPHRKVWC